MDSELERAIRQIVREEIAASLAGTSYEPTWTTAQVAEFLGLKPKTIRNRISLGEFPKPRKHGRANAFIPSEIVAYRAERLAPPEESRRG
ncbi:helix-turn-helix transcriptional regulator [Leucobacter chromiiresistens]